MKMLSGWWLLVLILQVWNQMVAAQTRSCENLCGFYNQLGPFVSTGDRGISSGCYCDTYCRQHKDCCPTYVQFCEIPQIASIQPTSASTAGSGGSVPALTITGSFFQATTGSISFGSAACTIVSWSVSQVLCNIPPGSGINIAVRLTTAGATPLLSNTASFSYLPPTVSTASPNPRPTNDATVVTLTGTNFGNNANNVRVTHGTTTGIVPTIVTANTQISFSAPAAEGQSVSVSVTVNGQVSSSLMLNIGAPTVSNLNPRVGPTSGGITVTVTGSNFGTSAAVSFNSVQLTTTRVSDSSLTFSLPAGIGSANAVVVSVQGQVSTIGPSSYFAFNAPQISSVTVAGGGSTAGGNLVTIVGTNFFTSSVVVNWGSATCPLSSTTPPTTTQIVCILPAGEGRLISVSVSVGGQVSNLMTYNYPDPSISSITPAQSFPTQGGNILTVSGNNFGLSSTVSVAGTDCPVQTRSHSSITCALPAGQGLNQPVVVRVLSVNSNSVNINYAAPTITSISPNSDFTSGGAIMTITGTNLGVSGSITVGGRVCNIASPGFAHTSVPCVIPRGMGSSLQVVVTIAGQSATSTSPNLFSYNAPTITSVTPNQGPTGGNVPITISGTSFGQTSGTTFGTVTIGSNLVCAPQTWTDTQIVCNLPIGTGVNLNVQVTPVVGSSGSLSAAFSYSLPTITSISPSSGPTSGGFTLTVSGSSFDVSGTVTLVSSIVPATLTCVTGTWGHSQITCTVPPGVGLGYTVLVTTSANRVSTQSLQFAFNAPSISSINPGQADTSGQVPITLVGNNFGSGTSGISAPSVTIGTQVCATTSASTTQIICTLAAGEGIGLPIAVTVAGQKSPPAPGQFNYNPPSITSINPTNGPTSGNVDLTITGTSFGILSSTVSVGGSNCVVKSRAHTQIVCTLPSGQGSSKAVQVTVASQLSNQVVFSYFGPTISGISSSAGFPTSGGVDITLTGTSFSTSGASVTVGGSVCAVKTQADTSITCTLPVGEGVSQPVIVNIAGTPSNVASLNYDAPQLTSISTAAANTQGGTNLVATGVNFGLTGSIFIGGAACSPVASRSHTSISCSIPSGQGTGLQVVATVQGRSSNALTFSYNPPSITSISPNSILTSGFVPITINGQNFGTFGTVTIDGTSCPPTGSGFSHTTIVCFAPAGQGARPLVTVTISGQISSSTVALTFAPPMFSSTSPINPLSGSTAGGFQITLAGSSFGRSSASITVAPRSQYPPNSVPGNTVFPANTSCLVQTQSHTQIVCTLAAGRGDVYVFLTVAGQSATNNGILFRYNSPSITSVTPNVGPTSGSIQLTVAGSSFDSSGTLTIAGAACPPILNGWTHTSIVCTLPAGVGATNALIVTQSLSFTYTASSSVNFPYSPPTLSSISPTVGPSAGLTFTLTLFGSNFGSSGSISISVGGNACPVTARQSNQVQCTVPPGEGAANAVIVEVAGQRSSSNVFFAYNVPVVGSISPSNGPTSGNIPVQISGSDFGLNPSVTIGGLPCPLINRTHSIIFCTLPAGQGTNQQVQVTVASQLSQSSVFFSYNGPTISAITPSTSLTNGNVLLTVTGTNFGQNSIVTVGGASCPIVSVATLRIVCMVPAGEGANRAVVVYVGSSISNSRLFSYAAPNIISVNPITADSQGSALITVFGTSFGISGFVTINGRSCDSSSGVFNHSTIVCSAPLGDGLNNPLIVTVSGQTSNTVLFSYNPPQVQSVQPVTGPTDALNTFLTIAGSSFGSSGSVLLYSPLSGASTQCPVVTGQYSHQLIVCQLPPGQGRNIIVVTSGTQNSTYLDTNSNAFTYSAPSLIVPSDTVSNPTPSTGSTQGGYPIVLIGSNFGVAGKVFIKDKECVPINSGWSHSRIECAAPIGTGLNLPVSVVSGGLRSNELSFAYFRPIVSSVSPTTGPTSGGLLTVVGSDFGANSSVVSVQIGATLCNSSSTTCRVFSVAQTTISINVTGTSATAVAGAVSVIVDQQASNNDQAFSNNIPVVSVVTSSGNTCAVGVQGGLVKCPINGGGVLTITGSNFGSIQSSSSLLSVSIGGVACSGVTMVTAHTVITCTLPQNLAGGFNLPVAVTYNGQTGSSNLLSYAGPIINPNSLHLQTGTASSSVTVSSTQSGTVIIFTGQDLDSGASGKAPNVTYGPPATPSLFACTSVQLSGAASLQTVSCSLSTGIGSNLVFQVQTGLLTSLPGTDVLNYPGPSLISNSIQLENGPTSNAVVGSSSQGQFIKFKGNNFGNRPELLTVVFGPVNSQPESKLFACSDISLESSNQVIRCRMAAGDGGPYVFQVRALNVWSAESSDTFKYPTVPVISSVSGCLPSNSSTTPPDSTGSSTVGCPTSGATVLTISGADFATENSSSVRVGSSICVISRFISSSQLLCQLPVGTGFSQSVVINSGILFSRAVQLVSYAAPRLTSLSGCPLNGCSRFGGDVITIIGSNFGAAKATVLIGDSACSSVTHDSVTPHLKLTCTTPSGAGQAKPVMLLQNNGALSSNFITLNYLPCPAGQIQDPVNPTNCVQCARGTFSATPGSPACRLCQPGYYASSLGASTCLAANSGSFSATLGAKSFTQCASGTYTDAPAQTACVVCNPGSASTNGAKCALCPAGFFAASAQSSTCSACSAGTYSFQSGFASCIPASAGSYVPSSGQNTSLQCLPGFFQSASGRSSCLPCAVGTYSSLSGAPVCKACDSGYFANTTGLSACLRCPAGSVSQRTSLSVGASTCTSCAVGSYINLDAQAVCLFCGQGSFSNISGASFCTSCTPGSFANSIGASSCSLCGVGSFASSSGSVTCSQCPQGSFTNQTGTVTCESCPAGYVQPASGSISCVACLPGTSIGETGQPKLTCNLCGPGTFSNISGAPSCSICPAGTAAQPASCSSGADCIQNLKGATTCSSCALGTSNNAPGQATCQRCAAGSFGGTQGLTSCDPCPAGSFSSVIGQAQCTACGAGLYSASPQSVFCLACPVGSVSNNATSTACDVCAVGTVAPNVGMSMCSNCSVGYFMNTVGQGVCLIAPVGKFVPIQGASSATDCPAGTFQNLPGQSSCNLCPEGQYTGTPGQVACLACPVGSTAPTKGSPGCTDCAPGFFSSLAGSLSCSPCGMGQYSSDPRSSQCLPCRVGEFTNAINSSTCTPASPGFFQPDTGKTTQLPCEKGQYQPIGGRGYCLPCPVGTYTALFNSTSCTSCAPGSFAGVAGLSACLACSVGRFSTSGNSLVQCSVCPTGTFASSTGMSSCAACAIGTFASLQQSAACASCEPGSFQDVTGQPDCKSCLEGYFSNSTASDQCSPCPVGKFSKAGASVCSDCAIGSANSVSGQLACPFCAPGSFSNITGQSACQLCPAGTDSIQQGSTSCRACSAGEYSASVGATSCAPCDIGRFSVAARSTTCESCLPGFEQGLPGSTTCKQCQPGRFAPTSGSLQCLQCPAGFYSDTVNASACLPCAKGYFQNLIGQSACRQCQPGTASDAIGQASCAACGFGFYSNTLAATSCQACQPGSSASGAQNTGCSPCAAGQFSVNSGAADCSSCPIGSFSRSSNSTSCELCPRGFAQSLSGATVCSVCTPGTYTNTIGSGFCLDCPVGFFGTSSGQTACFSCASGSFSNLPGRTTCAICSPGEFSVSSNGGVVSCSACPEGRFSSSANSSSCFDCPAGSFQNEIRQQSCKQCQAGTMQSLLGQTSCTACSPGRFSTSSGQSTCSMCAAGSFSNQLSGATVCTFCSPGTFQPSVDQQACLSCPEGSFTSTTGATSCSPCSNGTFADKSGSTVCFQCLMGRYSAFPGSSLCNATQPGFYQPNLGQSSALACPVGTFQDKLGQADCLLCVPGTANNITGRPSCQPCPAGRFMPVNGMQVECLPCPSGTHAPELGATACVNCSAGSFNPTIGQAQCKLCPSGLFQPNNASLSCQNCPVGTFQNFPGQSRCLDCQIGTYSNSSGQAFCVQCGVREFSNQTAQTSCQVCGVGTFNDEVGKSVCLQCGPGKFALTSANIDCNRCDVGTFNNLTGASGCQKCPIGSYQSALGGTSCTLCPPGKYSDTPGLQSCFLCPQGNYQNRSGATSCEPCSIGTFANLEGSEQCQLCNSGTFGNIVKASQCISCNPGSYQRLQGQTRCDLCPPGSFSSNQSAASCSPCGYGLFVATSGSPTCYPCPDGFSTNGTIGLSFCTPCPRGFFQQSVDSTDRVCRSCVTGKFSIDLGRRVCDTCPIGKSSQANQLIGVTSCQDCAPGRYGDSDGLCQLCQTGRYSNSTGVVSCAGCPPGRYTDEPGSLSCFSCPVGRFQSGQGQSICEPCPLGRFSNSNSSDTLLCSVCRPGQTTLGSGSSSCVDCSPGKYSLNGTCIDCDPGTFSNRSGQFTCDMCPSGRFASQPGAATCSECPVGSSTNGKLRSTSCSSCQPGQFSDKVGQSQCLPCQPGTFGNVAGLSSCFSCAAGSFNSNSSSTRCDPCPLGEYSSDDRVSCQQCPIGTYGDEIGLPDCKSCPIGRFSATTGQQMCQPCESGTFASTVRSDQCSRCNPGSFADVEGLANCKLCPVGKYAPLDGQVSCTGCLSGTFAEFPGQSACINCPPGTFTDSNVSSSCRPCPAGQFASEGVGSCQNCPPGSFSVSGAPECSSCPPRTVAPFAGTSSCTQCDPNSFVASLTDCACNKGFYAIDWMPASSQCYPCPTGFECFSAGVRLSTLKVRAGFWFNRSLLFDFPPGFGFTNLPPAIRCTLTSNCLGGPLLPINQFNGGGTNSTPQQTNVVSSSTDSMSRETFLLLLKKSQLHLDSIIPEFDGSSHPSSSLPSTPSVSFLNPSLLAADSAPNMSTCEEIVARTDTLKNDPVVIRCTVMLAEMRDDACPVGSFGPLCGICKLGFYKNSNSVCISCPSGQKTVAFFVLATIGVIILFAVMLWIVLRSSSKLMKQEQMKDRQRLDAEIADWNIPEEMNRDQERSDALTRIGPDGELIVPPDFTYKLKIILTFVQIGVAITSGVAIAWPRTFQNIIDQLTFVNFDFIGMSSVDCVQRVDYYNRYLTMTMLPIILVACVYVFYLLPKRFGLFFKDSDEMSAKRSRRRFWKISTFFLFLIYPSVSASVLGIYNCQDVFGQFLLREDFSVDCSTSKHRDFMYGSIPLVLLYPIGIPMFLMYKVYQYRYPKDGRSSRLNEPGVMAELGFLYDAYNRELWFFEFVDLFHKLVLTSIIVFFPRGWELATGMIVVISYMSLILYFKPYARKSDDRLQLLALAELFLIMLTTRSFQTIIDLQPKYDAAFSYGLFAVCGLFLVFFSIQLVQTVRKLYKLYLLEKDDNSLADDDEDETDAKDKIEEPDELSHAPPPPVDDEDQDQESREMDEMDAELEVLDMKNMSSAAVAEIKAAMEQRRIRREQRRLQALEAKHMRDKAAEEAEIERAAAQAGAMVVRVPDSSSSAAALPKMIDAKGAVELVSVNPVFRFDSEASKKRRDELRDEVVLREKEPELFNTPQGKYIKLSAYSESQRRFAEKAAAENAPKVLGDRASQVSSHPLASTIKKVPVSMAPPVLLHQQQQQSSASSVAKKEVTARAPHKK